MHREHTLPTLLDGSPHDGGNSANSRERLAGHCEPSGGLEEQFDVPYALDNSWNKSRHRVENLHIIVRLSTKGYLVSSTILEPSRNRQTLLMANWDCDWNNCIRLHFGSTIWWKNSGPSQAPRGESTMIIFLQFLFPTSRFPTETTHN